MTQTFRIGAVFPQVEIESDPVAVRDFAQGVEAMGYSHLLAYDHVLGADVALRPGWNGPYTAENPFVEPMVLFAFLAAHTRRLLLSTGVIILPQRQTALFAKQAANVDVLLNGRLRVAVGVGWNPVEYEALGVDFGKRGALLDEQIHVLRRLWTEEVITEHGLFHHITAAGINPLPRQRPIPVWVGGTSEAAIRRAARLADGWLPMFPAGKATSTMDLFRSALVAAGRPLDEAQVENITSLGSLSRRLRSLEEVCADVTAWRAAGAAGVAIHTMGVGLRGAGQHLSMFRRLAELLLLRPGAPPDAP